LFDIEEAKVND